MSDRPRDGYDAAALRFLHTADWQIGMRAAHVGVAGAAVREERMAAATRVVNAAIEHDVAFIAVTGDTFEDNGVDRLLVQRVADVLARFPRDVYLLPGNHDPLVPGSVWDHPAWSQARLHVIGDAASIVVEGGTLWPCPLREKIGRADPTAWIPARDDSHGIRVCLAHGTVEGVATEEPYFPIPRDVAGRRDVDFVAIGHWHSYGSIASADGAVRLAYSGTHEPTKFGERDSGNALLVEIDAPLAPPKLTPIRTGRLRWTRWDEECRVDGDIARLIERLQAEPATDAMLLSITLRGVATANERQHLSRLRDLAAARCFHHRIDADAMQPAPNDAGWIDRLPPGVVRATAERLRSFSEPLSTDRPSDVSADTAGRALLELYAAIASQDGDAR